jgi:hypothetical protein
MNNNRSYAYANTAISAVTQAIYVGGAGNVCVLMESGEQATFANVAAGTLLPIRVVSIIANSTTATGILALR